MGRPLMSVVSAQQQVINDLRVQQAYLIKVLGMQAAQIGRIANLAGITAEMDEIRKAADIDNPAQPVPDPGEQAATETTEQAVTPETHDDVRAPGQTPGSTNRVPAEATDVAIQPGGTMPSQPFTNLIDVTAPTQGTQGDEVPLEQRRIETDVRTLPPGPGGQMNPQVAFPWNISPNDSNVAPPTDGEQSHGGKTSARTADEGDFTAYLRLARLRMAAGLAPTNSVDDLAYASSLRSEGLTRELVNHEIGTLQRVAGVRPSGATMRGDAVPRPQPTAVKERRAPSLASAPAPLTATASVGGDPGDYEMFMNDGDYEGL